MLDGTEQKAMFPVFKIIIILDKVSLWSHPDGRFLGSGNGEQTTHTY